MDMQLAGKVAVISGGASGIGLATVKALAGEGATVVAGDLNTQGLIDAGIKNVVPVEANLATEEGANRLVKTAIDQFGQIDVLINNVGIFRQREGFLGTSMEDWKTSFDINFYSMVTLSKAALPYMIERKSGSIVSVASECGRQPDVFLVDYSVTKAAMLSLSKSLANEFGPVGIRSNIVSPGPTRTHQWDMPGGITDYLAAEFKLEREAAVEHFAKQIRKLPLGRLNTPDEVASVIVFLSSGLAAQVTGAEYTVNAGSLLAA